MAAVFWMACISISMTRPDSRRNAARAERVIAAHAAALAAGQGVVLLDGRLIENLHVEAARRVRALAAAITPLAG